MSDLDKKVDDLEAAKEKYLSANTVISIGGYAFTPAKLMVAFTIVSSTLGGLYGAFEVYKDYQDMKSKIAKYVAPDLSEIYKKVELSQANAEKTAQYSQDINNDLKSDIRRLENVVENVERSSKTDQRLTDSGLKEIKRDVDATLKEINKEMVKNQKEQQAEVRQLRAEVDQKIK